jgi:hypothetical protein
MLLGLWQGAWEAPPDEVRAAQSNMTAVPVGVGIVAPARRIVEVLSLPEVKAMRDETLAASELPAADPQSVPIPRELAPDEPDDSDWRDPAEAARLRDATLRRMLNTPPKPQNEMKLGKRGRRS